MNFDFQAILMLATLFAGVVYALDHWLWAAKRTARHTGDGPVKLPVVVDYSRSLFPVLLVVFTLRSFVVEPFRIPSGSMIPTLEIGDFILVNKFAYGLEIPLIEKEILDLGAPERGDVIVFRYPVDKKTDYIKRVVGLPGDTISYHNKQVFVNGVPMAQRGNTLVNDPSNPFAHSHQREERLDGVKHAILIDDNRPIIDGEFVVPEHQYFVMGDNRDNSNDSRYWGTVPDEMLVGKAFMIWMNFHDWSIAWSRIGKHIQ